MSVVAARMEHMSDPQLPTAPPPHPYAVPERPSPRGSGALSIASMGAGLAGIVTAVISLLYFAPGAILAAFLGLAAVVLGIFGLISRLLKVPAFVGVISGAISVVAAIIVGIMLLIVSATPTAGGGSISAPGQSGTNAEIVWPRNMATGAVTFTADGVAPSDAPGSEAPEPTDSIATKHRVQLYVDYRCPYCGQFESTNGATLDQIVSSGQVTLELTPLSFLDRIGTDYYSSRAAGALACVADAQPEAAWDVNRHLFDRSVQPAESTPGLDNDALIDAVDAGAGGLNDDARSCIETEKFVPFAQALNSWAFANPVPHAEDPDLAITGTPFVVVDGVPYSGALDDSGAFTKFLAGQGIAVGAAS